MQPALAIEEPAGLGRSSVEGVLQQVTFSNEESGWSVLKVACPGRADPVTVVGHVVGLQLGDTLRFKGDWVTDKRFGQQFKAFSFEPVRPSTKDGIERFLASGLIAGVGHALAARIVEKFGETTLDLIDKEPQRLREVRGIGKGRLKKILDSWAEQNAIRDVMVFLGSHGVTAAYSVRIFKKFKQDSIRVIKENPYRLADDIFGIGFVMADRLARSLGTPMESVERAKAGVYYHLGEVSRDGHVFYPLEALVEETRELLAIPAEVIRAGFLKLVDEKEVIAERMLDGSGGWAVYLRRLHAAETGVARVGKTALAIAGTALDTGAARALAAFEKANGVLLAPEQKQAVLAALAGRFLVITGGPGTGKTTTLRAVVELLSGQGKRILLGSPTGRAAKRLNEATGREAKTLHRLMEWDPTKGAFKRNRQNPLEADALVIDEVSMLDIELAYDLFRAAPEHCQMVMVGDVDQLPSVGPGNVLRDLIRCGAVEVVRLQHIFRQGKGSLIVENAHRVNHGEMPVSPVPGEVADFYFIEREKPEDVLATVKDLVSKRIPDRFGFDPMNDIQVLAPMLRGTLGIHSLNGELQNLLNPLGTQVPFGSRPFRVGDRVLQMSNDYDRGVFNGDLGRVSSFSTEDRTVAVNFDGPLVKYEVASLVELQLAYACTVHKVQGSEYPVIVLPFHTQHWMMLFRGLLYTALTRARKLAVIVGSRRAVSEAVKSDRTDKRYSQLAERLAAAARL